MRKINYLLAFVSVFSLISCDKKGEENNLLNSSNYTYGDALKLPVRDDYSEYNFPDYSKENHFNNVEQYANMQGYMGWYYCYGSTDENNLEYMVFNGFSGKYKTTSNLEAYVQKDEWQPSMEHEIMCCFKSPKSGNVSVNIDLTLIYEQAQGDDGISFYCLTSTNIDDSFGSAYLVGTSRVSKIETQIDVHKDEVLYFVMSCNEGRYNDLSRVVIDLTFGG